MQRYGQQPNFSGQAQQQSGVRAGMPKTPGWGQQGPTQQINRAPNPWQPQQQQQPTGVSPAQTGAWRMGVPAQNYRQQTPGYRPPRQQQQPQPPASKAPWQAPNLDQSPEAVARRKANWGQRNGMPDPGSIPRPTVPQPPGGYQNQWNPARGGQDPAQQGQQQPSAPQPPQGPTRQPQQPATPTFGQNSNNPNAAGGWAQPTMNTSIQPNDIYSQDHIRRAGNLAAAQNTPAWGDMMAGRSRPGMSANSGLTQWGAGADLGAGLANALNQRQQTGQNLGFANAMNNLAGQGARHQEALGWGGLMGQDWQNQLANRNQYQGNLFGMLSNLYRA